MIEVKKHTSKDIWWKPAMEIFSQVSVWIAVPIILALVFGKILDANYGTKPWIFLGFTGLAFLISSAGIVKVIGKYMKNINDIKK